MSLYSIVFIRTVKPGIVASSVAVVGLVAGLGGRVFAARQVQSA